MSEDYEYGYEDGRADAAAGRSKNYNGYDKEPEYVRGYDAGWADAHEDEQPGTPAWIVVADWINSSQTYYGPFETERLAGEWALGSVLANDDACTGWELATIQPATAAVSS